MSEKLPDTPRSSETPKPKQLKPEPIMGVPVVCNLAAWFNAPDVGYQPHYGRKKRVKK